MTSARIRLSHIHQRIATACLETGRTPDEIRLLAVSKKHPASSIVELIHCGITNFGESYVSEAIQKIREVSALLASSSLPKWHFIGPIQSNKTAAIATGFDWVHSVDRSKLLSRLNSQRPDELPPLNVCLQLASTSTPQRSGTDESHIQLLAAETHAAPHLKLRGLMYIPPLSHDLDTQRSNFHLARTCFDELKLQYPYLDTLSMGMSQDLEAAVSKGSSLVRIGTALFGPRL